MFQLYFHSLRIFLMSKMIFNQWKYDFQSLKIISNVFFYFYWLRIFWMLKIISNPWKCYFQAIEKHFHALGAFPSIKYISSGWKCKFFSLTCNSWKYFHRFKIFLMNRNISSYWRYSRLWKYRKYIQCMEIF